MLTYLALIGGILDLFANERECHYFVDTKFRSSTHTVIQCKKDSVVRLPSSNVKNHNQKAINFPKQSTYIHFISLFSSRRIEGRNNVVPFLFISAVGLHILLGYGFHAGLKVAIGFVYKFRACNCGGSFIFLTQQSQL